MYDIFPFEKFSSIHFYYSELNAFGSSIDFSIKNIFVYLSTNYSIFWISKVSSNKLETQPLSTIQSDRFS